MKLKLVNCDNYRYRHPEHGFGVIRKGDVFEVADSYGEGLLRAGRKIPQGGEGDTIFIPLFEKVADTTPESEVKSTVVEAAPDNSNEVKVPEKEDAPRTRKKAEPK